MQKNFWLYLILMVGASTLNINAVKLDKPKKNHKFQRDQWLIMRDKIKRKKSNGKNTDNRYELQLSPSHTVENSAFQLREKVDIDQATIHEGRTATKAAAHFDAEGA